MSRWKERWNDLLLYEKIFDVIGWVLACGYLILAVLLLLDYVVFWIVFWLLAPGYICAAVTSWRKARGTAYLYIVFAVTTAFFATWKTIEIFG